MAKTQRTTRTATRTARRAAAVDQALSDAPGSVADVRAATPTGPNPPAQPTMIPAKQVTHQVVGAAPAVDPDEIVSHPRDRSKPIRVQATALGYYDDVLRRVDDVFDIFRPQDFSKKWMRKVSPSTPEVVTGSNRALRKGAAANEPAGGADPLGADE